MYTYHMSGARNWHGSYYYDAYGLHFPTPVLESYMYADTSFALTVLNNTTVCIGTDTFIYQVSDSIQQIHFFGTAYYFYQFGAGSGIAYYYGKDSLVYCYGDIHGTSDSWVIRDLRWTF